MPFDPDEQRAASRESWETAATGWGRNAERIRDWGMPVSVTMLDVLHLQPGQRVLELAAGPGDTGFMAAELVIPGGTLICSDGAEAMVEVARERAGALGITNVAFCQLELEWIDLSTAEVDAVLCRWGIMFCVDPGAAAREMRRILVPGGHVALGVWDLAERNPWATLPSATLIGMGLSQPPDPDLPGMFSMAADGVLADLLDEAGFHEVEVRPVTLSRRYGSPEQFVADTTEMSPMFSSVYSELAPAQRDEVARELIRAVTPYRADDGAVVLPGQALVASAVA